MYAKTVCFLLIVSDSIFPGSNKNAGRLNLVLADSDLQEGGLYYRVRFHFVRHVVLTTPHRWIRRLSAESLMR